jgi:AraC-like DNA-binding protein
LNKQNEPLCPHSAVLLRPCLDTHSLQSEDPSSVILNIRMHTPLVKQFCNSISETFYDDLLKKENIKLSFNERQLKKIIDYTSLIRANPAEANISTIYFLMSYIFEKVFSQNNFLNAEKPQWLTDLLLKIFSPENMHWSVNDVTENAPFSHPHLIRLFKQYEGCTLIEYLTRVKMQHACELLVSSDMSILAIAMALGYSDSSHLNRTFKKIYNLTPSEYRQQRKKNI